MDLETLTLRAQGCLIGQCVGDALGAQVEFQSSADLARTYPAGVQDLVGGGPWGLIAGQITDDSELALMLARSVVERGRYDARATLEAYVHWLNSEPFDVGGTIGRALRAAAQAIRAGQDPLVAVRDAADPDSQANGAMMRVCPLALYGWRLPAEDLAALARRDAALTHPHRVCQEANAVFVVALQAALTAGDGLPNGAALHARVLHWAQRQGLSVPVRAALERAGHEPPVCDQVNRGWVLVALQNAFYQLASGCSVGEGLVDTVMRGGDTDTNAAIAGALLGAAHGVMAIPSRWRSAVLGCEPATGAEGVRHPRPTEFWPRDARRLGQALLAAGAPRPGGPGRPVIGGAVLGRPAR